MDRLIALLAALVGLIALGGALLVHNSSTALMARQASEIAALKETIASAQPVAIPATVDAAPDRPAEDTGTAETIAALEARVATLEKTSNTQAIDLAAARAALEAQAGALTPAPVTEIAVAETEPEPESSAAFSADGPTTDCIPLGTRFMAQSGDSFPICKTQVVIEVSAVTDGSATIAGTEPIAAGAFANLPVQGCTLMVFTADTSGFAEMRVSCV